MRKLAWVFVLLLLTSSCRKSGSSGNLPVARYIHSDEVSNQYITSFCEDAFGYMWIGTFRGLNRYNGADFIQFFSGDDSSDISHNQIRQLIRDSKNRLWVSTGFGVGYITERNTIHNVKMSGKSPNVLGLFEDREGRIFINLYMQMCEYKADEDRFVPVMNFGPKDLAGYVHFDGKNRMWTIGPQRVNVYESGSHKLLKQYELRRPLKYGHFLSNGRLWMADDQGLTILNTKTGAFEEVPDAVRRHPLLNQSSVRIIYQYQEDQVLLYTGKGGFFLYNGQSGSVVHQSENGFPFEAPDFDVTTLYTDKNKNLWIGSYDRGFVVRYHYKQRFNGNQFLRSHLQNKSVISVVPGPNKKLWVVAHKDGLYLYQPERSSIEKVNTSSVFGRNPVHAAFSDIQNRLWLMSDNRLACCEANGAVLKPILTATFSGFINHLSQDQSGTIWVGGFGEKIYALKPGEKQFSELGLYQPGFNFINSIITLENGKVLVAGFEQNLCMINPTDWSIEWIEIKKSIPKGQFIPTSLCQDRDGNIWVGTYGNGILRYIPSTGKVEQMPLPACNDISSLIVDAQGDVWVGTLAGMSRWNRETRSFINFFARDGITGNQLNERSVCRYADNNLIFGCTQGITLFNPVEPEASRHVSLYFEDLKVRSQAVAPGSSSSFGKALIYSPDVRLSHNDNTFAVTFSAVDYSEFPRVRYHYMLEGFDDQWIDAQNSNQIFYSNLPAGKYILKVKAYSIDNVPLGAENSIVIRVKSAPWLSWPALLLYFVLFLAIAALIVYLYLKMKEDRIKTSMAIREKEQEQYANRMNMSYFSNVSHEFRTPLTMISGPVSLLCKDESIKGESRQMLTIVQRNVNRMLRLVNQMMDFHKLESDALRLSIGKTDVVAALRNMLEIFSLNAQEKGITLKSFGLEDTFYAFIDQDKLEKILVNIISNALKFSVKGSSVDLRFDVVSHSEVISVFGSEEKVAEGRYMLVSISDRGPGIPPDKIKEVFHRFYQIDQHSKACYNWGTGIGLYFASKLIDLHHGFIKAANRDGGGCTFTFALPVDERSYSAKVLTGTDKQSTPEMEELPVATIPDNQVNSAANAPLLLLVDDDTDITIYLKSLLSARYRIENRFDAESAYKSLEEISPDIIICDVLMPGMDGFEFCRILKENPAYCHIPVILLTARSTVDLQVEGLNAGADAYVTKPFDPGYLQALIKSQLKNREMVRHMLSSSTDAARIEESVLSPHDKAFLDNLYALMERELSNPELNISFMTETLKISRTKFYYKVKGLTGQNPNVFFKNYKLNRAAELIKEGKNNISEIADITGFSTLSHFSVSFKKQFGISPSEYRQ